MYLFEHQATINPNIPLRNLLYVADLYQVMVKEFDVYGSTRIKIPAPRFVVFYNGERECEDVFEYRLSDLFEKQEKDPRLELKVTVYNINSGYNEELKLACEKLREYSEFTDCARKYKKAGCDTTASVNMAIDECIEKGILREFLIKNKAEVIKMTLYEFDEEKYREFLKREAYEDGRAEGMTLGRAEGETAGRSKIIENALRKGKSPEEISEFGGVPLEEVRRVQEAMLVEE